MLKILCGPSGSGKTRRIIDEIRSDIERGIRTYLLVPEQQAYISERDLPARLPQNAGLYFEVVNFSRLAEDVFRAYGGVTSPSVTPGARALLMWNTLRTLAPMLTQYGHSAAKDTSLTDLMLATVAELRTGGVEVPALEEAAMSLDEGDPLRKKLSDLALIDATFHQSLETAFGADPADKLLRMAQKLSEHAFFAGAHVYIDSFTDFTVPEYAVLREILKQADALTVAFCTDAPHSRLPHFEVVSESVRRMEKLAQEVSAPVETTVLTVTNREKPEALQFLERNLWNFSYRAENRPTLTEEVVRLTAASNIYEECEAAAAQIEEWVMDGMSFGDIAVVVRDTEPYRGVLDAALERHGIPYFLSERTDLASKSVSRLILSALRAVAHNYRQSDIMTLLKTGLCGVDLRDGAMFEEYCETWHIGGKRFFDDLWSMNPDGLTTERSARADRILDAANRVRRTLMEPLAALASEMRASTRISDRCRALYDYLARLQIAQKLSEHAREELSHGNRRGAGESIRLYQLILDTLTTLSTLLPNEEVTLEEFIASLSLLFSNSDLGSVPDQRDCVIVGSASTLRVENVRASMLLGLCEGEFPRAIGDDGILTESDKVTLEGLGMILSSRAHARSCEELFYVYRAMTKPRERLALFTVSQDLAGSQKMPSLAFSRVSYLLGRKPESFDLDEVRRAEGRAELSSLRGALEVPSVKAPITLRLSASKIQTFVLCPYRYYNTYALRLREKKDSTPTYADDGVFMHYIFEHFLRASLGEDGKLHLPTADEIEAIADRIIADYLREVCPIPPEEMDNRLLHIYARLRKLALTMLADILTELQVSLFTPARFEQIIGMPGENGLPALTLTLENGSTVTLSGKIDRVDLYKSDERVYVRVVDYKSSKHTFSLDEVRSGMDIQLVLYLFAFLAAEPDMIGAGSQYLFASRERGQTEIGRHGFYRNEEALLQAANGEFPSQYTKGLIAQTAEEMEDLHRQMCDAVTSVATRILSGEAQKTPSEKACKFCPLRTHCGSVFRK